MNSLKQKLNKLLTAIKRLWKAKPNEFNTRYHEKFTNTDNCQWQGGRLLTKNELKCMPHNNKTHV